jgi:hypothetical protein
MNIDKINYNEKYKFKIEGFFYKYTYKYVDYLSNINICNNNILTNKNFSISIIFEYKNVLKYISLGILTCNIFKTYKKIIPYIYNKINKFQLKNNIRIKEIIINI